MRIEEENGAEIRILLQIIECFMITNLSFEDFCRKCYDFAKKTADTIVADYTLKYDKLPAAIDPDLVKDSAVITALEKAYNTYDPDNKSKASLKTYLSKILKNQIYTEIEKEATATGVKLKYSLDKGYYYGCSLIQKNDSLGKWTDTISHDVDNENSDKLFSCIKQLTKEDQIIIGCYLFDPKSYVESALERLGWDQSKRGLVITRKRRAVEAIKQMVGNDSATEGDTKELEHVDEPVTEEPKKQIYAYNIKLSAMKSDVETIKKYFGLNHPNLDLELLLVEDDPEREFRLIAFVPYEEIEAAFVESSFNPVGNSEDYICLLWLVANLYFGDMYDRYEEAAMEEEADFLRWDFIRQEIIQLYGFMANHKAETSISVKIGTDRVELNNSFGWFQALLKNHLFPKCIPDITDVEAANKAMAKERGRKTESKVSTAVVNGISSYFKDEGLVSSRAPKNLCSFIRKMLIMMHLKDGNDKTFSDAAVKNWINNIQNQKETPKIYTPEIREVSVEELKNIPLNERAERWLFSLE